MREKHRGKDQMKSLSEYKFMLIPCTFNAKPSVHATSWLSTLSFESYPKFAPVSRMTALTGLWDLVTGGSHRHLYWHAKGMVHCCLSLDWWLEAGNELFQLTPYVIKLQPQWDTSIPRPSVCRNPVRQLYR